MASPEPYKPDRVMRAFFWGVMGISILAALLDVFFWAIGGAPPSGGWGRELLHDFGVFMMLLLGFLYGRLRAYEQMFQQLEDMRAETDRIGAEASSTLAELKEKVLRQLPPMNGQPLGDGA